MQDDTDCPPNGCTVPRLAMWLGRLAMLLFPGIRSRLELAVRFYWRHPHHCRGVDATTVLVPVFCPAVISGTDCMAWHGIACLCTEECNANQSSKQAINRAYECRRPALWAGEERRLFAPIPSWQPMEPAQPGVVSAR